VNLLRCIIVRCYVSASGYSTRNMYKYTYVVTDMFLNNDTLAALLVDNGKFLLSAKRTRRATCTEYVISMDADNISRSSNTYIGKLR